MRVSLWLPTFTSGGFDPRQFAQRAVMAEKLGYYGIYLLDHLLPISGVHTSSWFETVVGLSVLAEVTEQVVIGTASMIVGFRHPVLLAKQLASVAALAGPRVVFGASAGWYAPEYEAFGYLITERGPRTDETLEALDLLLSRRAVTFEGRFWRFTDVTIEPRPPGRIPILVGGGSRTSEAGSDRDAASMRNTVLRRIIRWDGWIAPCSGREELTYRDLELVRSAVGQARLSAGTFTLAHVQWTHIVQTADRHRALRQQLPLFRELMGRHHSDQHLIDAYLLGSVDDIAGRVARLRAHGFDEIIVSPVTHEADQIELIAETLMPVAGASEPRSNDLMRDSSGPYREGR